MPIEKINKQIVLPEIIKKSKQTYLLLIFCSPIIMLSIFSYGILNYLMADFSYHIFFVNKFIGFTAAGISFFVNWVFYWLLKDGVYFFFPNMLQINIFKKYLACFDIYRDKEATKNLFIHLIKNRPEATSLFVFISSQIKELNFEVKKDFQERKKNIDLREPEKINVFCEKELLHVVSLPPKKVKTL